MKMHRPDSKSARVWIGWLGLILLVIVIIFSSCNFPGGTSVAVQKTLNILYAQQTSLVQTVAAFTQAAQFTPQPTSTPADYQLPTVAATLPITTTAVPLTNVDERAIKSAKILLFEDMSASRHIRYVKLALDQADYFYVDVGSAKGWFKDMLLSDEQWDLVIAAAEARRDFGGEFFGYINNRIGQGAGAVVEFWDYDAAPMGRVSQLFNRCGIEFQLDWYEPDMRVFFWLVPDHPVFQQPNPIPTLLGNAMQLWSGDIGDLLQVKIRNGVPQGDAVLLAGTNSQWKNDHGVLVSCVGGRVILQTFGSHEYRMDNVVLLWQNYIYQALKNHFLAAPQYAPPPPVTPQAVISEPGTPTVVPPVPGIGADISCGGVLTAKVLRTPLFQKDLFEHHARGIFMILNLQLVNQTDVPVQIWDSDYALEGELNGKPVVYSVHKAATGYLYIERPKNTWQDRIDPGEYWHTTLAFDVDPQGKNWVFVVKPGSEFNEQICEVRIRLE